MTYCRSCRNRGAESSDGLCAYCWALREIDAQIAELDRIEAQLDRYAASLREGVTI